METARQNTADFKESGIAIQSFNESVARENNPQDFTPTSADELLELGHEQSGLPIHGPVACWML